MKGRNEIREVFGKGKRIGCQGAKLFMLKNNLPHNRICFALPGKFGNAVERNRAKRLGREVYRNLKPDLRTGASGHNCYDLVLLVYSGDSRQIFTERAGQMRYLFGRAGLLR